jgi:hypothetical protein
MTNELELDVIETEGPWPFRVGDMAIMRTGSQPGLVVATRTTNGVEEIQVRWKSTKKESWHNSHTFDPYMPARA